MSACVCVCIFGSIDNQDTSGLLSPRGSRRVRQWLSTARVIVFGSGMEEEGLLVSAGPLVSTKGAEVSHISAARLRTHKAPGTLRMIKHVYYEEKNTHIRP